MLQSRSKLVETLHFFERVTSSFHYVAFFQTLPAPHHFKVVLFEMLTDQKLKIRANNIVFGGKGFAKIVFMKRYDIKISFSGKCLNPFDRDCSFKNLKFPRGNYETDSSETQTVHYLYRSPLIFFLRASLKIILNYYVKFLDQRRKSQTQTLKKKTDKKTIFANKYYSSGYFAQTCNLGRKSLSADEEYRVTNKNRRKFNGEL